MTQLSTPSDVAPAAAPPLEQAADGAGERPSAEPAGRTPAEINQTIRYTMYSVFAADPLDDLDRAYATDELRRALGDLTQRGLEVRGLYDLSGMRADADLMVWWHAPSVELVQEAYRSLRRTVLGRSLRPVWSSVGLHRPAEFNRGHVPAFMAGEPPRRYLSVYPFVRSYEWYLLPEGERRQMLRDHGLAAMPYPDVRANTVSAFSLGDYEWLLAFEADDLHRIVDLMRDLRATEARRHVREELPFFTGRRVELAEAVELLP